MQDGTTTKDTSFTDVLLLLKKWFIYLRSKWMLVIIAGILGGAIGYVYALNKKIIYTATLNFALDDDKGSGGLGGALGLASQMGLDLGGSAGGAFAGTNLIELIVSRSMVEKTLLKPVNYGGKDISFAELYVDYKGWREKWASDANLSKMHFLPQEDRAGYTRQKDSVMGMIFKVIAGEELSVYPEEKKGMIIDISMKTENEFFAKKFVEALADEVSLFYVDVKTKKSSANLASLQRQTDSVRNELNHSISGVASSIDQTFNLNSAIISKRVPSQTRQIDVQANTAILIELVKNLEMAKATLRKETPLIQIIDHPIFPLPKQRVGKIKTALGGALFAGFLVCFIFIARRLFIDTFSKLKEEEKG